MSVTVVGSVAFDSLKTPFGVRDRVMGGAASHFALAASMFTDVSVVGVVGDDFGDDEMAVFEDRGIDTHDLRRIEGAKSFFWRGSYDDDMQVAHTLETQLNVFADFDPVLSAHACGCSTLFLANIQPDLQRRVREQCPHAFSGIDSMNYWIESARGSLLEAIRAVDVVVLNDAEIRMLTNEPNLAKGARQLRELGPRVLVAKLGSYGACMFADDSVFFVPGYPLETVIDPTGAGDSFAGGFFGFLDQHGTQHVTDELLRCAAVYGSVMASFTIEDFGNERLRSLTMDEVETRMRDFKHMTHFESRPLLAPQGAPLGAI
jgi:sugar/nucleoside kinase (ribokinase family)